MERQLEAMEYFSWLGHKKYPFNFALCAEISGKISSGQLKKVLKMLQKRHPFFKARVFKKKGIPCLTTRKTEDFIIRSVISNRKNTWKEEVEKEIQRKFDLDTGPPFSFVLVKSSPSTYLIINCHHGRCDGMSALYLLKDIFILLGDSQAELAPLPGLPVFKKMFSAAVIKNIPRKRPRFSRVTREVEAVDYKTAEKSPFLIKTWKLERMMTLRLIQRCREEKTTVHFALCTAFLKAFADLFHKETGYNRRVSCPVNMRGRLLNPVGEHIGSYITLFSICPDCSPARRFWDIAREMKTEYDKIKKRRSLLTKFALFKEPIPAEFYKKKMAAPVKRPFYKVNYDLSITNLGKLSFPIRSGLYSVKNLYGPIINARRNEKILGVLTLDNRLYFSFVWRQFLMSQKSGRSIINKAVRILKKAVG